jgi:sugar phosphate isomerase/epimerase
MRLSCCAYSYRQPLQNDTMSLEAFLETVRDMHLDGVELTAYYFPSTERAYLNQLKRRAHELGLAISGTAIGSDFAQPEAEKRRAHIQMTKEWTDHSVVLGAPTLRVFAGPVREGSTQEQAFGWVVECLQECAAYAAERGVLLALENHGGLTSTADQTLALLQAVDSEWLGLNLDFGNFSGDAYTQIAQCASYAVATHAKIVYKGVGGHEKVDYRHVRSIMENVGYRGFLAIEYEENEDPLTAVPAFARELQEAFA